MLYALILIGGTSKRMGQDKAFINMGKGQPYLYIWKMLQQFSEVKKTFFSVNDNNSQYIHSQGFPYIKDEIPQAGPLIALYSAMKRYPQVAWLIVGCDYPLLEKTLLQKLLQQRNINTAATAWKNTAHKLETVLAIYEYSIFPALVDCINNKNYSLQKLLSSCRVHSVPLEPHNETQLCNINTPNDLDKLTHFINKNTMK